MERVCGTFDVVRDGYEAAGRWIGYYEWCMSDDPRGEYDYDVSGIYIDELYKYDEEQDELVPVPINSCPDTVTEAIQDECTRQLEDTIEKGVE